MPDLPDHIIDQLAKLLAEAINRRQANREAA